MTMMKQVLKYLMIVAALLIHWSASAQGESAEKKGGLIAIAFDDTGFKRAFEVFETGSLSSDSMRWPGKNDWSMKCRGQFIAPVSGEITLYVESDHSIQVDVDGLTRLNAQQDDQDRTFSMAVRKGREYPIEIAYVHNGGEAFLKVSWSWKGQDKVIIPGIALRYLPEEKDRYEEVLKNTGDYSDQVYLQIPNPDPTRIPSLEVWQHREQTLVGISFPGIPGLICDSWCYESELSLKDIIALDGGRVKLIHEYDLYPFLNLVTLVTPEPCGATFDAWIERRTGSSESFPETVGSPNLCWQLKRAVNFNSEGSSYPDFVKRCFMITEDGMTFLDQTDRKKIPVRAPDEEVNNPPWVQNYLKEGEQVHVFDPGSWAGYSDTRFTENIIGTVSKDGNYLTAIACSSAPLMCQAWHDCMHNNPAWLPAGAPVDQRIWRLKIYAMKNDPEALISHVKADFPEDVPVTPDDVRKIKESAHWGSTYQTVGCIQNLPVFLDRAKDRQIYPLSWLSGDFTDFNAWKAEARETIYNSWLSLPPDVPFNPVVIQEEDRGSYTAQKIVLNISADSRILAYMLKPKGDGPFPALLLLHDHGARFDIGKEKMIRPFQNDRPEIIESSKEWADELYGGRVIGDELAGRGYVCFCTDALNWGDRFGGGQMAQQAIGSNMLNLGMSFAGLIAYEDVRAARFLASQPEVDPGRVAAAGLSMGSYRTWQVAAMSDDIKAGVAVCWMATHKGLMTYFNNQTNGHSAYPMTHPGLSRYLDYPDVAGLACPKPMLFYNGLEDPLFPVPAVKEAYAKMRSIWESQDAGDKLVTSLWPVPHQFNREMQEAAFNWLDTIMEK